jgi:hypothetical protein
MREIKEIIKEIRETEKIATTKLDEIDYRSRGGMGVAIRNACEHLPKLLEELKNTTIPHRLVAVFAKGDETVISKVSEFLLANGGLVMDANAMYRQVTDQVEPSYGPNRVFGTTQFHLLYDSLREIMGTVEQNELPAPKFIDSICPNTRATINHVRRLVRAACQDNLSIAYLTKMLSNEIIKKALEAKQIPILVVDVSSPEEKVLINTLFAKATTYDFSKDFQVNKNSVIKLFKSSQNGDGATNEESTQGATNE